MGEDAAANTYAASYAVGALEESVAVTNPDRGIHTGKKSVRICGHSFFLSLNQDQRWSTPFVRLSTLSKVIP